IETLNHEEAAHLASILTRFAAHTITRDHYNYWGYCGFLVMEKQIYKSSTDDWYFAFFSLLNLVLASQVHHRLNSFEDTQRYFTELRRFINSHAQHVISGLEQWTIAEPLSYALLEGLLRRKNAKYVGTDG